MSPLAGTIWGVSHSGEYIRIYCPCWWISGRGWGNQVDVVKIVLECPDSTKTSAFFFKPKSAESKLFVVLFKMNNFLKKKLKNSIFQQKRSQAPPMKPAKKKTFENVSIPTEQQYNKNWKTFNAVLSDHKITYKLRRARG